MRNSGKNTVLCQFSDLEESPRTESQHSKSLLCLHIRTRKYFLIVIFTMFRLLYNLSFFRCLSFYVTLKNFESKSLFSSRGADCSYFAFNAVSYQTQKVKQAREHKPMRFIEVRIDSKTITLEKIKD